MKRQIARFRRLSESQFGGRPGPGDRYPEALRALAVEHRAKTVHAADELVDASSAEIDRSEKIDPFDVADAAVYLSTLGKYTVVHNLVIDRLGADW
jgi:hypothetical protein